MCTFIPAISNYEKITGLMAAMLPVVTTITAGLTALPGSGQEAQTNLCIDNSVLQFPTDQGTFGETSQISSVKSQPAQ